MITRKTTKNHLELDLDAAAKLFADTVTKEELSGEFVTSAWDVYAVETLRECHTLRAGSSVPTDIFVFGKGEPDNPSCTKVGGRPFWPRGRDWPTTADGSPCFFLAQFNFSDSLDIVGNNLPGDLLLLLTDSEEDWQFEEKELSFEWISASITPDSDLSVRSTVGPAGPFFGVVHRSADYPEASEAASVLKISQSYNLPVFSGTKIGGVPQFIQGGRRADGSFLCQLGSIQAAPGVPYPWVNRTEHLDLQFNENGIHGNNNCAVFGDMGAIYIFIDKAGKVSRSFDCY